MILIICAKNTILFLVPTLYAALVLFSHNSTEFPFRRLIITLCYFSTLTTCLIVSKLHIYLQIIKL